MQIKLLFHTKIVFRVFFLFSHGYFPGDRHIYFCVKLQKISKFNIIKMESLCLQLFGFLYEGSFPGGFLFVLDFIIEKRHYVGKQQSEFSVRGKILFLVRTENLVLHFKLV